MAQVETPVEDRLRSMVAEAKEHSLSTSEVSLEVSVAAPQYTVGGVQIIPIREWVRVSPLASVVLGLVLPRAPRQLRREGTQIVVVSV